MTGRRSASSFRDPSGFVLESGGEIYRAINERYREDYETLVSTGLLDELVSDRLMVGHEEAGIDRFDSERPWKIIKPERIPFISYPYEWSFSQLKDAALLTLTIQKRAMKRGMTLKDASAYNIQFIGSRPILIDTLSFERYEEGKPWNAYRQFTEHFLAPLALMAYRDQRLAGLLRHHNEGIPLDIASKILPLRSRFKFPILTHIHLHASGQKAFEGRGSRESGLRVSRHAVEGIIESLESGVSSLSPGRSRSTWSDYYIETNYDEKAFEEKKRIVGEWIERLSPSMIWDLGANTGIFSRIAAKSGYTVSMDLDPIAVERNYTALRPTDSLPLLPLVMDLMNPSGGIGWRNRERSGLAVRGPADLVMALALVHHLAIGNNLPLVEIAEAFSEWGKSLVVEFVPKEDSQAERLLAVREDIFDEYSIAGFREAFSMNFEIIEERPIEGTKRTLFLMRRT